MLGIILCHLNFVRSNDLQLSDHIHRGLRIDSHKNSRSSCYRLVLNISIRRLYCTRVDSVIDRSHSYFFFLGNTGFSFFLIKDVNGYRWGVKNTTFKIAVKQHSIH